jgi:cytidine deaminase
VVNKELILKLIERARAVAENAYCPYTNEPVGCAILVDDNMIFCGCNVENGVLSCGAEAAEVAIFKAVSEGYMKFLAIALWSGRRLPYPSGRVRQILSEFSRTINIVVANDETYALTALSDLFPFPPEVVGG